MIDDTKELLWLAVEDYAGLWEAVWELRSNHPDASDDFLEEQAKTSLSDLLLRGLIQLYRGPCSSDDIWPLDDNVAVGALSETENWNEPRHEDDIVIRFSATSTGEAMVLTPSR